MNRNTVLENPPISRLALVAIASNTGCTSDGEQAITLRISAVAVCRSSASLVSLNRRTFSMAITAWSAKVCSSATCWSPKAAGSAQPTVIAPIGSPLRSIGTMTWLRVPSAAIICREAAARTRRLRCR